MRCLLAVLLLGGSLLAQDLSPARQDSPATKGTFYVAGIVYQYVAGTDYTVVAAAHAVLNHRFLAVKVRVYNGGRQSVTVKPEDVLLEDANGSHALAVVSGAELARKMRHPYNWARYAVTPVAGEAPEATDESAVITPQLVEMMKAMAARAAEPVATPADQDVLYTDTPGALRSGEATPDSSVCDQVCHLRNVEANHPDVLTQLQRQTEPDYVERSAFLANTIPPRANAAGVLYCPLGKLSESREESAHGKKGRRVRVTVPVGAENFQLVLPVE